MYTIRTVHRCFQRSKGVHLLSIRSICIQYCLLYMVAINLFLRKLCTYVHMLHTCIRMYDIICCSFTYMYIFDSMTLILGLYVCAVLRVLCMCLHVLPLHHSSYLRILHCRKSVKICFQSFYRGTLQTGSPLRTFLLIRLLTWTRSTQKNTSAVE